jgi:hypothetical protein
MKPLGQAVKDYLALRRSLGFKLLEYGDCLHEFVSFLKKNRAAHITNKLAVEYANTKNPSRGHADSSSSVVLPAIASGLIREPKYLLAGCCRSDPSGQDPISTLMMNSAACSKQR